MEQQHKGTISVLTEFTPVKPALVAQLDACLTEDQEVAGLTPPG